MTHSGTIFLIDDDAVVNYLHAKTLSRLGITDTRAFELAADAIEVLKETETNEQNIIFLDLNMPFMDGWEFLDAFHQLPEKTRNRYAVVVISSSIDPKDIERSKEYEVFSFISKPLTQEKAEKILQDLRQ